MFLLKNASPITKLSLLLPALLLSACASQEIANSKQFEAEATKQAKYSSQAPLQVCQTASSAIKTANSEELYFFAPLHFEQASADLEAGQELIKSKDTQTQGVQKCFKVSKLIESGLITKTEVQSSLKEAITQIAMLKKVDESKQFIDDIQEFVDDTIALAKQIEAGKMNSALQQQASLLKEMLELEIEIVTNKNLGPVKLVIKKAERLHAKVLAEQTFEKAEAEYEIAKQFIMVNYRDDQEVKAASAVAMRAAKHAFHIAKEVEKLQDLDAEEAETTILYFESLLEQVNQQFNQDVLIGHSFAEQISIIRDRLNTVLNGTMPPQNKAVSTAKMQQAKQAKTKTSETKPAVIGSAETTKANQPVVKTATKITPEKQASAEPAGEPHVKKPIVVKAEDNSKSKKITAE